MSKHKKNNKRKGNYFSEKHFSGDFFSDKTLEGKINLFLKGDGFVTIQNGSERSGAPEEIYIPARCNKRSLDGDTVRIRILGFSRKQGKRREGEVVEVISRGQTDYPGNVQINGNTAFLIPDKRKMYVDFFIPVKKLNGAKDGDKAIARFVRWGENNDNPEGEIIKLLGKAGDNATEMRSLIAEYGFRESFSPEVEKETSAMLAAITGDEIAKRRDFRSVLTFTIDPEDAKDFDDAISLNSKGNGIFEVGVHIADVTHFIKPGSVTDDEALKRSTSVYLSDRVIPMLPERLSNGICSLSPGEDKLCFAAVFTLNKDAEIINEWFGKTVIHSGKRYTYESAQRVIEDSGPTSAGNSDGKFSQALLTLNMLAKQIRKKRFDEGSISFEKQEVRAMLDDKGNPIGFMVKEMKDSNRLIEDFMLLANRRVAEFLKFPALFRVHDKPDKEKLAAFAGFVRKFGYKFNLPDTKNLSASYNRLLEEVKGKPEQYLIETIAVRTMAKAIYTTDNIGHYGLGFSHYTHFTSPIRRYPDMLVHRLLEHRLKKEESYYSLKKLEKMCKHSSENERKAEEAERASLKLKQVQYLSKKVGNQYDGIISGVTEWGMFVELSESKCEGVVRLNDMDDDYYIYDAENYRFTGRKSHKRYQLGDKVNVIVVRVDITKRQVDFMLAP